jgi:hypothetical protein
MNRAKVLRHNQKLKQKKRDQLLLQAISNDEEMTDKVTNAEEDESKPKVSKKNEKKRKRNQSENMAKIADPLSTTNNSSTTSKNTNSTLPRLDEMHSGEYDDVYRDQGFVRPRLLILCPFRHTARKIIDMMIRILGPNTSISNYEKFQEEYADPIEDDPNDEKQLDPYNYQLYKQQKKRQERQQTSSHGPVKKPADWEAIFKGNMDDDFKVSICLCFCSLLLFSLFPLIT